ncbi:MAG TPA: hypothetical protein VK272_13065 [Solirubrobacteraceae bacterium]|nr:hypothetical protein [Solirubrobacteraceae bacterium]
MHLTRTVHAELVERFIFNFRLAPEALAEKLPVPWIVPQVINGWSVMSFCILSLDHVVLGPLPGILGCRTLSCAHRFGVVDISGPKPEPAVYVLDRSSDRGIISGLGGLVFASTVSRAHVAIAGGENDDLAIGVRDVNAEAMFSATVQRDGGREFESDVFDSLDGAASFIRSGVSSYAPSLSSNSLARVDLHKEDTVYQPVSAAVDFDCVGAAWRRAGLRFDSAIRTAGGRYRWTYRGRRPAESQHERPRVRALRAAA